VATSEPRRKLLCARSALDRALQEAKLTKPEPAFGKDGFSGRWGETQDQSLRRMSSKVHLPAVRHIDNPRYMEPIAALGAFAALSQATRLEAFRTLARSEPRGLPAGEVARQLGVPQNTMSTHLAILTSAGLVSSERFGRSIVYRAKIDKIREVASFLVSDCCGGRPELCEPLVAEFTPCCTPENGKNAC